MARVIGLCVLAVLMCCVHLAASEASSHSELYQKLRALFENKRVLEVADEVKRDMAEEKEKREHKDGLMSELTRLLNNKKQREETEERPWERREETEERPWERREETEYEGSLFKRLLNFLKDSKMKRPEWYDKKPKREDYSNYTSCFLLDTEEKYTDLRPKDCQYYLTRNNEITKPCQQFCRDWTNKLKEATGCTYDDMDSLKYCETRAKENKCQCTGSLLYYCCGSCKRCSVQR